MTFKASGKQIVLVTILNLMVLTLLGCSNQNLSTSGQTPASTSTSQPDISMTPTFTAEPTNILSFTPTPTSSTTPEPNEAKDVLQQLLVSQRLCKSPCFWGITPNQTTLGEAQNIFNDIGLDLTQTSQEGEKVFYATSFGLENGLVTSIVLSVQNDLVNSTRTNIGFANYNGSSPLQETAAFSPKSIQSQNGVPTYIEFYISRAPSDGSTPYSISYAMIIYFDPSDLVVEYKSQLIEDKKIITVCPLTDKFDSIRVWHGNNVEDAPAREGVPIERVTSLTPEQFGDLIAGEPNNACFELNTENFP